MSNNLGERIFKNSALAILLTLIGAVFAYLIRIQYSNTLSIENYGLFYAIFGLFSALSTYSDLGFGEAISYFIPKYFKQKNYSKLWNTYLYGQFIQFAISTILAIIIAIAAPFLANNYFKVPGSETLIYIFCIFLILNGFLNGINQIFTGLQKASYFSTINTLKTFFILSFSLVLLINGSQNVNAYGLVWVTSYFLTVSIYIILLFKNHSFLTDSKFIKSLQFLKSLSAYALPAFFTTFIYSLMQASDIFFLTLFRGVVDVGVYNIIVPIASISIIFLAPMHNILLPLTSDLMEGEKDKMQKVLSEIYKIIPFLGIYFALFTILFPSSIISFIFGEKWLYLAGLPLSLLTAGYVFLLLANLLGTVALGLGKIKERLKILTIIGALNIVFDAILIWRFGILGSVIMDSLIAIVLVITFTHMIKIHVKFNIPYQFYLKITLFSLLIFLIIRYLSIKPLNFIELIVYGIVYSVIFLGYGYFAKVYTKNTFNLIRPTSLK